MPKNGKVEPISGTQPSDDGFAQKERVVIAKMEGQNVISCPDCGTTLFEVLVQTDFTTPATLDYKKAQIVADIEHSNQGDRCLRCPECESLNVDYRFDKDERWWKVVPKEIQIKEMFRVPNNEEGKKFIEQFRKYLNRNTYKMKVRGRKPNEASKERNRKSWQSIPLKYADELGVYVENKEKPLGGI